MDHIYSANLCHPGDGNKSNRKHWTSAALSDSEAPVSSETKLWAPAKAPNRGIQTAAKRHLFGYGIGPEPVSLCFTMFHYVSPAFVQATSVAASSRGT